MDMYGGEGIPAEGLTRNAEKYECKEDDLADEVKP